MLVCNLIIHFTYGIQINISYNQLIADIILAKKGPNNQRCD